VFLGVWVGGFFFGVEEILLPLSKGRGLARGGYRDLFLSCIYSGEKD